MESDSAGLRRWTQSFTVLSATTLVAYFAAILGGSTHRIRVVIGIFGFVCPMVFGMAYLLLPPYVGRTLTDQRVAGVHFGLTLGGVGLLVGGYLLDFSTATTLGVVLWSLGVLVFLSALVWTIGPPFWNQLRTDSTQTTRPQRLTRLATAAIPIALGYLLVATGGLFVNAVTPVVSVITLQRVVHYYAIGFGGLLVIALGTRLLIGFFHVSLPRYVVWPVLVSGILAPVFLGSYLWVDPWFRVGAALEVVAMIGYTVLVLLVAYRSEWNRIGLYGIVLGAVSGTVAVLLGVRIAFGMAEPGYVAGHISVILGGFFPLTIIGYAYQFFPVTNGQFLGATTEVATATIILLAAGVILHGGGILSRHTLIQGLGTIVSLVGASGYWYLITRRFLG